MDKISGKELIKADGSTSSVDQALADKEIVCFYFSAHWCPPCRQFTPILKDFYAEANDMGVEIIFVSSDKSHDDMISYMKESHGDWFALKHGDDSVKELKENFQISGIPSLIVLKKDGTLITKEGRNHVQGKGPNAVKEWKA
ncbi:hypothetical protein TCAL_01845 [Tigriopus californicus]|uniref:Thioredoxin domain-containing protein n=1 Tax=Tigriopus californicus TaxID=6832 RepID=A0A553NDB1_TIGCA|nr:nucleoredoxin-like protein 2 [Tigriopus californicus]TRY63398.1 hypothetical protein TCAL_01845 [Tigriopus californicus]|eukprot:TCALIF_01845-PA protein Name:"Similar to Nxnl2 Nucleoredoxin-like protein 2 (Mus musculus)" AED:0.05 eAED:0.05 QI:158/1/1/1/0.5/0.33/3/263/141